MSLDRLEYDAATTTVTYASDKTDGPTAGRHAFEAMEFIARLVDPIPDKGQVLQRYYGYYGAGPRRAGRSVGDGAAGGRGGDRRGMSAAGGIRYWQ